MIWEKIWCDRKAVSGPLDSYEPSSLIYLGKSINTWLARRSYNIGHVRLPFRHTYDVVHCRSCLSRQENSGLYGIPHTVINESHNPTKHSGSTGIYFIILSVSILDDGIQIFLFFFLDLWFCLWCRSIQYYWSCLLIVDASISH